MEYSVERFTTGEAIIWIHSRIGVIPVVYLKDEHSVVDLSNKLLASINKPDIPDAFKEAME